MVRCLTHVALRNGFYVFIVMGVAMDAICAGSRRRRFREQGARATRRCKGLGAQGKPARGTLGGGGSASLGGGGRETGRRRGASNALLDAHQHSVYRALARMGVR